MKSNVSAVGKSLRVAGVEALVDVPGHARDAEFLAHVAAGAAAAHRVEAPVPGLKYLSKSLIRLPPQLPGHLRSPYSPARWKW